jgi:radical SAM superfamily enzyme with C-terminal helix-hairpin-helix motif
MDSAVILDCYTVEPSGLGVPPYLSPYVREAFSALAALYGSDRVSYVTIDDVRWALNGGAAFTQAPLSDPLTYSQTLNRPRVLQKLHDATTVLVIAGDAVPSAHLQAQNGSPEDIARALACTRGVRILLGPLTVDVLLNAKQYQGLFDALHTHSVTPNTLFSGSRTAPSYESLRQNRQSYLELINQLGWNTIAEIEMYRGCTRRVFCGFCNEPVKNAAVTFREVDDILDEMALLYAAGVRSFRLGQQTCFFSYMNRNEREIARLLTSIREQYPDIEVLHIDNADPLAVASNVGGRIAALVAQFCTEGNCAPMGVESFDLAVVKRNALTCTPEVAFRAIENINKVGTSVGPLGFPKLLPGLNLIYGLPGETHRTHFENLFHLARILDQGFQCHRTNVRQAKSYPGTPLAADSGRIDLPSAKHFDTWKADVSEIYDQPMKSQVYPVGRELKGMHSFFVSTRGTWYRRLGSYSIQVVERDTHTPLYERADMIVVDHAPRYIYGERRGSDRIRSAA